MRGSHYRPIGPTCHARSVVQTALWAVISKQTVNLYGPIAHKVS